MYSDSRIRRSWVEVDLNKLIQNYNIYKSHLPENCEIMAVVKADAYGHGDVPVCKALHEHGVHNYAVSNIDEALALREIMQDANILILGYTPVECARTLYENNIMQALLSEEYAEALSAAGYRLKCQFAIDTGMNRIGLLSDDPVYCEDVIRKYANIFDLCGIFTHLCVADSSNPDDHSYTLRQIDHFRSVYEKIADLDLPFVHCLNTAGGMFYYDDCPTELSKIVRLGISMYGLSPAAEITLPEGITPALTWKTSISMIKNVEKDCFIGYGRTYKTERAIKVATVPTGYADGYSRQLSNRGYVLINGRRAPIVGKVCMDQMMIDVTGIPDISRGDEVILIGSSGNETLTADHLASIAGTIGYEIICGISKRVPRLYI